MKVVKNILSLFLVLTILNTFIGKTIHELLFHNHEEIHCEATTTQHYHEQKSPSTDLVCSFNFTTTFLTIQKNELKELFGFYKTIKPEKHQRSFQNQFLEKLSLRGPPFC